MYPPNQPKVHPVRPRSSLSTDDHHRTKDTNRRHHGERRSSTLLTLAGFIIFLFVICVILLAALIYVVRNIVRERNNNISTSYILTEAENLLDQTATVKKSLVSRDGSLGLPTNSILRFRTTVISTSPPTVNSVQLVESKTMSLPAEIRSVSKISSLLGYRLPNELRPRNYNIVLHPDIENKTFNGTVRIQLEILKPISYIPIHAKFLNVTTENVTQLGEDLIPVANITPLLTFNHPKYEYWVTEFAEPLSIGNYSLKFNFNGSLTDRIVGFYQSSYFDKQRAQRRWIATSKFEPTYARQAFPCFDEPAMKAQFSVTLVRPSGDNYHALSNMEEINEIPMGDFTEVEFEETVPMSTYLMCFIVSDFAHKSTTIAAVLPNSEEFQLRVFSTPAQIEKVNYALDVASSITEYYIKYFNISYPLPKLDLVGVPDFVSGAMEHWGLVTFRESNLLYDEKISSSANKQRLVSVIAHELAHMWFGNLVTMKWWNDLWLNEGFAKFLEYKGINEVHPEWNIFYQFLLIDLHSVMLLDATLASHPIVQTVLNPNQITELFDSITYSKGASIVRLLEDLVGDEKFALATTSYLNKFYYSNAETDDFFNEIEAQGFDFDVKLILQTWTVQMGYPVVQVTATETGYMLTQKRFLANPLDENSPVEESPFNYRWSIPITYFTSAGKDVKRLIFNHDDNEVNIKIEEPLLWLKFNKDQIGYYRVNYETKMWENLTSALMYNRGVFSPADRAHLLNDAFALADASQLDIGIAMNLTLYLEKELDYVPWAVAASQIIFLKRILHYTPLYIDYIAYARKLINNVYESLTWDVGQDHLQNCLRVTILDVACSLGHKLPLKEAAIRFVAWLNNPSERPDPDIRRIVYYYGMQENGNESAWNKVFDLYLNEQDAQEKNKLMEALAAIREPWLLQRYITLAWNESNVRGQDYFTCLSYISANPVGSNIVWDYVRENWPKIANRFNINDRYLGRLIPTITKSFHSQTKLEEMENFFAKYPDAGAGASARKEALEAIKIKIKWLESNTDGMNDWLQSQKAESRASKPRAVY